MGYPSSKRISLFDQHGPALDLYWTTCWIWGTWEGIFLLGGEIATKHNITIECFSKIDVSY
jgi:hypothetical protein